MNELLSSFSAYAKSLQLARRHGWWSYIWIPVGVSIVIGLGLIALIVYSAPSVSNAVDSYYPWDTARSLVSVTIAIFTTILILSSGVLIFKYLILIIAFPFMSFLSQKVEKSLYGNVVGYESGPSYIQFVKEILRGIGISARLIFLEVAWVIGLLLLSLIPGVAIITGPAIFLVHAYYAGCANMDYTLERFYNISDALRFMKDHFWMTLGNGIVFMLIFSIPVIGIFISPVWGTMSASLTALNILRDEETV